jgi:hypothetical protein
VPLDGCIAFEGDRVIESGPLADVALAVKRAVDRKGGHDTILVFDAITSEPIELDLRGTVADVKRRVASRTAAPAEAPGPASPRRAPGRPRLGVVAREVTLLPRHWEWLGTQPGGASITLRKLVEQARQESGPRDRRRRAQESAYRFMVAMAGNLHGFEEATRALFGGDAARFDHLTEVWPADLRTHARSLAALAFAAGR